MTRLLIPALALVASLASGCRHRKEETTPATPAPAAISPLCEQAYNELPASIKLSESEASAKERYIARCTSRSKPEQQCMVKSYWMAHSDECRELTEKRYGPVPRLKDDAADALNAARAVPQTGTLCEQAYASKKVLTDSFKTSFLPRDEFLAFCKDLPPSAQQCMVVGYRLAHRKECEDSSAKLEADLEKKIEAIGVRK